jgi:hypothetical protein
MLSSYFSTCRLIPQVAESCVLYGFSDVLQPIDSVIFVTRYLDKLPNFILSDGGQRLAAKAVEKAKERVLGVILGIIPAFGGRHWSEPGRLQLGSPCPDRDMTRASAECKVGKLTLSR